MKPGRAVSAACAGRSLAPPSGHASPVVWFVNPSTQTRTDSIEIPVNPFRAVMNSQGTKLFVDLSNPADIKRVLVFALIYEGAANWAAANGVATLTPVGAPPIEVLLDDPRDGARICAIAQITNQGGEIVINREVNYLDGAQRALDEAYGWGMNWTRGRK